MAYSYDEALEASLDYFDGDNMRATTFLQKYALKSLDGNEYYEKDPDDLHDRLADEFYRIEKMYPNPLSREKIREELDGFGHIIPNGSPMAAIGNDIQLMSASNCFVAGNTADSYGGILSMDEDLTQIMKRRGGVGVDISHLRPKGANVSNAARSSTGAVSFMERLSGTTREVAQGGRRGALMITMHIRHPESEDFIEIKSDETSVTGANVSLKVTDDFMRAVYEDESFVQRFPVDASPEEAKFTKEVNAKKLWHKIVSTARDHAEPGVLFWDKMTSYTPADCYADLGYKTHSTNPCVTGDTLISTDQGLVEASVLAKKGPQKVVTDERIDDSRKYRKTTDVGIYETGTKDVYKVETEEGYTLRLTKDHKVKTDNGWVEARNLQIDSKVHIRKQVGGFGNQGSEEKGRVLGWLVGDGFTSDNTAYLDFYTDEMHLGEPFADDVNQIVRSSESNRKYKASARKVSENQVRIGSNRLYEIAEKEELNQNKLQVPHSVKTGSKSMQKGFLRALFSADGSVQGSIEKGASVRLSSKSSALLSEAQQLLLNFGIFSVVYHDRKSPGIRELPNQRGGYSEYQTEGFHDLVISKDDLIRFKNRVGFLLDRKQEELESILDKYEQGPYSRNFTATIQNIEKDGKEKVYDLTEPETSSFVADGFVVHNCGEVPLEIGGACRLTAMNLFSFVRNPFTDGAYFDFDKFRESVHIGQRIMDDIVQLDIEKIDEIIDKVNRDEEPDHVKHHELNLWQNIREHAEESRRTGLGLTALGDALAGLGVRYGSEKSMEITDEILRTQKVEAYRESVNLAKERGTFDFYDAEREKGNPFIERLRENDEDLVEEMENHGRRNIAVLSIAPTGTVSQMAKTTSGIENLFQPYYQRRRKVNPDDEEVEVDFVDEVGDAWQEFIVFHPRFKQWLDVQGYEVDTDNPDMERLEELRKESPYDGATVSDVDWVSKVKLQGVIQKHIDHSISVTTNLPEDISVERVKDVYEQSWRSECKGCTIYRQGSRSGVLTDAGEDEKKEGISYHDAPERPEELECDIHQVRYAGEPWKILVGRLDEDPYEIFAIKTGGDTGIRIRFTDSDGNKIEEGIIRKVGSGEYDLEANDGKKIVEDIAEYAPDDHARVATRLLSLALRHGVEPEYIVNQLESANGSVVSFGRAVLKAMRRYLDVDPSDACPECSENQLVYQEGCVTCRACGYSRCS